MFIFFIQSPILCGETGDSPFSYNRSYASRDLEGMPLTEAQPRRALLHLEHICKRFSGATVLADVCFDVLPGEVHALVGENGAGKSTLMNVVSGVVQPDAGAIVWDGREVTVANPRAARDLGIGFVHQELALVPHLNVAENIFLGRYPARAFGLPFVKWKELRNRTQRVLAKLGCDLDPGRRIADLSIGERQLVEIARGLAFDSRLIIMDEPTAPLPGDEVQRLLAVVRGLKDDGISIVFITHRLKEVYALADRVTVLRDGRHVAAAPVSEMPEDLLVLHMVGRRISEDTTFRPSSARSAVALRLEGLERQSAYRDINLQVRSGEIVALAGLLGAGRTEVLESVFGVSPPDRGRVWVDGAETPIRSPSDAIHAGIGLVPDDRRAKGLIPGASVLTNTVLASRRQFAIRAREEDDAAARITGELNVRTSSLHAPVNQLSGGNQQKVVLAKWLLANVRILLMDEPTRGVDVGAKAEMYSIIRALAETGVAILFASSEMDEVLRLAERIIVFRNGSIAGQLSRSEASDEAIMRLATGVSQR
jgi:ribose transport system ATP-binding protein